MIPYAYAEDMTVMPSRLMGQMTPPGYAADIAVTILLVLAVAYGARSVSARLRIHAVASALVYWVVFVAGLAALVPVLVYLVFPIGMIVSGN